MSNPSTPALLSVRGLCLTLRSRPVLANLSFEIPRGSLTSIIGPNGAGKSSLLKVLAQVIPATAGVITLLNERVSSKRRERTARLVGFLPQSLECGLGYTAEEFVQVGLLPFSNAKQFHGAAFEQAVAAALALTDAAEFTGRQMVELSAGERQLVFLAAALVHKPSLLLLDEPAAYLDPTRSVRLGRVLQRLSREHGITALVVEHDLNRASQIASHLLALRAGQLHYFGPTAAALQGDMLEELYQESFLRLPIPGRSGIVVTPRGETA